MLCMIGKHVSANTPMNTLYSQSYLSEITLKIE